MASIPPIDLYIGIAYIEACPDCRGVAQAG